MLANFLLWKAFLPSAHQVVSPSPVALNGAPADGIFSAGDDMLETIDTADWAQQHMPVNELVLKPPPRFPRYSLNVRLLHLRKKWGRISVMSEFWGKRVGLWRLCSLKHTAECVQICWFLLFSKVKEEKPSSYVQLFMSCLPLWYCQWRKTETGGRTRGESHRAGADLWTGVFHTGYFSGNWMSKRQKKLFSVSFSPVGWNITSVLIFSPTNNAILELKDQRLPNPEKNQLRGSREAVSLLFVINVGRGAFKWEAGVCVPAADGGQAHSWSATGTRTECAAGPATDWDTSHRFVLQVDTPTRQNLMQPLKPSSAASKLPPDSRSTIN